MASIFLTGCFATGHSVARTASADRTPTANNATATGATGTAPTGHTVGGTVTGLSGSLTLEDNGGDPLTLTANGRFDFHVPATTYNVTIQTHPTGQTCTATNGAGTATTNVTTITITCRDLADFVSDDFARANGPLGAGWTDMADGGLAISAQQVVGTDAAEYSGDIRSGETYSSQQSSQLELTSTQLSGTQWIGPAVRAQNNGADTYVGAYSWNNNKSELVLFKRVDTNWTQLGGIPTRPLPAGTQLTLTATGSTLTFSVNGKTAITATDTTLAGGNPAIMAYGTPAADNWTATGATGMAPTGYTVGGTVTGLSGSLTLEDNGADPLTLTTNGRFNFDRPTTHYDVSIQSNHTGGACTTTNGTGTATTTVTGVTITCTKGLQVTFQGTGADGIKDYSSVSANDGGTPETLRVLAPTHPAVGVKHNFLYVLPVVPGVGTAYGDGIETLASLDAEDKYNLTLIEPAFPLDPWYADSSTNPAAQLETFMTADLVPWVNAHLAETHTEQNWLIGFSKSGFGAQDLLLRNPNVFTLAASWDFPADMSSYDQFEGGAGDNYGTQSNFVDNYELTPAFLRAHSRPFRTSNRIWLGGYKVFQSDVEDYDFLLSSEGMEHTMGPMQPVAHRWDSGWVPGALASLYHDSLNLASGR